MIYDFEVGDILEFTKHPGVEVEIISIKNMGHRAYYDYRVTRQDKFPNHVGNVLKSIDISIYGPKILKPITKTTALSKLINNIYIKEKKKLSKQS